MPLQPSLPSDQESLRFDTMTDEQRLELKARYRDASPFRHLVIDGLFPSEGLRRVASEFDAAPAIAWREINSELQRKRATSPNSPLPESVQDYFNILNSGPFIRFLSDITGIVDLIPDPALYGGGMHEVGEGGAFEVHVDFQRHPRTHLNNRLTVITYLNDGWTLSDGGHLELWEVKPASCSAVVMPVFGRTVIMEQSDTAAHGHPQPVRAGRKRRSVTAYFYTNGLASAATSNLLPTTYVARRGHSTQQRAELLLRLVAPPIVLMGLRACKAAAQNARQLSRGWPHWSGR